MSKLSIAEEVACLSCCITLPSTDKL